MDRGDFVVVVVGGRICDGDVVVVVFRTLMVVWRCKAGRRVVLMVVEVSSSSVDGSTSTDDGSRRY